MCVSPPAVKQEIKQADADFRTFFHPQRPNSIAALKHYVPQANFWPMSIMSTLNEYANAISLNSWHQQSSSVIT